MSPRDDTLADERSPMAATRCEFLAVDALQDWIASHCLRDGQVDRLEVERLAASVRRGVAQGQVWRGEFVVRDQDLERIVATRIASVPGDAGHLLLLTEEVTRSRLERRLGRLRSHVLGLISDHTPLPEVLDALVREAEGVVPQGYCCLWLLGEDGRERATRLPPGLPPALGSALAVQFPTQDDHAAEDGAPGAQPSTERDREAADWQGLEDCLRQVQPGICRAAPVLVDGRQVGLLALWWARAHEPENFDRQLADELASLAGKAVEHDKLLRRLVEPVMGPSQFDLLLRERSAREEASRFERLRTGVLVLMAEGKPLLEILEALALGMEAVLPGALCSLRLLAPPDHRLGKCVAPSLPAFYRQATDRLMEDAGIPSLGSRTARGERVVTPDLQADPEWAPLRGVAKSAGLHACWAEPVRSAENTVVGSVAVYHRGTSFKPGVFFVTVVEESARLAALAIAQSRTQGKLAAREARLRTLVRAMPFLIWMKDTHGVYLLCNPLFEEFLGAREADILGHADHDFFSRSDADAYRATDLKAMAGRVAVTNESWLSFARDGRRGLFETMKVPLQDADGTLIGVLGIARDVTGPRRLQDDLEHAKEAAETASRAKGDFLANMSHEIRTPMSAIMGLLDLALRTPLTGQQHDYLDKAQGAARALLGLLNGVLDLSKMEAGQLAIDAVPFGLDEVFESLGDLLELSAERKGLELIFFVDPLVPARLVGDPLRIGQVLTNLAGNAVKFTERGEIEIAATVVALDEHAVRLRFTVRDTGIGMEDLQQSRLFQPFSQGDSSVTRRFGGTGLGLAISRRLVEAMQGTIEVESFAGVGSTFSFELPLEVTTDKRKAHAPLPAELRGLKVLVVEPNETVRAVLETLLAQLGFGMEPTRSAAAALDLLERDPALRLVLLDGRLPDGEASAVAHRMRARVGDGRQLGIVLMTTSFAVHEAAASGDAEIFDHFLRKPVTADKLLDALLQALGKSAGMRAGLRHQDLGLDPASLESLRGARLLLVEDNDINRQVASELLGVAGITLALAHNGQEALDALGAEDFDGVLMDIQMPVMDGYTATRLIRADPRWNALPVIALSANVMADDQARALAVGMSVVITKPVEPRVLIATLLKWIRPGLAGRGPGDLVPASRPPPPPGGLPAGLVQVPGLDTARGLRHLAGSPALYLKLLRDFVTDHGDDLAALRERLAAGDVETAQCIAHTLKGLLGTLGASGCELAAAGLDRSLLRADPAACTRALDSLAASFAPLLAGITAGLPPLAAYTPTEVAAPDTIARQLDELAALLRERDPDCVERAAGLQATLPASAVELGTQLARDCQRYDFVAARKSLDALRAQLRPARDGADLRYDPR